jgi:porphobilinogen deaminase
LLRRFLFKRLDGNCQTPVGVFSLIHIGRISHIILQKSVYSEEIRRMDPSLVNHRQPGVGLPSRSG